VRRINPIYLLIALNVILILLRDVLLPEELTASIATNVEAALVRLGPWGYAIIIAAYVVCGFFLVPLLIPFNILGGALYGAWIGTAIALAGITLATIASIASVRHVFTGMQSSIESRPSLRRLIAAADRHRNLTVLMVRFSVIAPYLLQNIALAATSISTKRITLITAVSAIPGAAIYSLLGAGLVKADDVRELLLYVAVPMLLMLMLTGAIAWLRDKQTD
jgi:uncharacterized membrane protein YdjX (TVP38/TMEM64 family)